jgi:hypothetical protein
MALRYNPYLAVEAERTVEKERPCPVLGKDAYVRDHPPAAAARLGAGADRVDRQGVVSRNSTEALGIPGPLSHRLSLCIPCSTALS